MTIFFKKIYKYKIDILHMIILAPNFAKTPVVEKKIFNIHIKLKIYSPHNMK